MFEHAHRPDASAPTTSLPGSRRGAAVRAAVLWPTLVRHGVRQGRTRVGLAGGTVTLILVALLLWWMRLRCESSCMAAGREAGAPFERGDFRGALSRLDDSDARCRCSRFTQGDEPPEASLARACLKKMVDGGRESETRQILANARGPILRGMQLPSSE